MKVTRLFRDIVKNPVMTVFLLALAALMAFMIVGDIKNMQASATNYE